MTVYKNRLTGLGRLQIFFYERAASANQTGTAGRFEIPFAAGELTVSGYLRKGTPAKIGMDLSVAVFDFDIYAEDTVILGVEGFWQDGGTDDISTYPALLAAGRWILFYVGKSYGLVSLFLPTPGSWNQSSFMFYAIQNTMDFSQYYRLAYVYTGMSDVAWTLAAGTRAGATGTETKFFNETYDTQLQMKVGF